MNEWQEFKISALIDQGKLEINDGYRAKNSELSSSGLPFARAQNVNNGFLFEDADCFPLDGLKKVGKKISKPGDVVFTSKGTVGRFAYVREDTPRFVYAPQLCFWRSLDETVIHPRWLYYWMQSNEFYRQYKGVSGQTDMAEYVNLQDQRRMYLAIPPLSVQRGIVEILAGLDDKIANNTKINHHLEQMAQAIFKSWFVDFEPFANGDFIDTKLGKIPAGWQIGIVGDVVRLQRGHDLPINTVTYGNYPVIGSKGIIAYHNEYTSKAPVIILGRSGNIGLPRYYNKDCWAHNTAIYSKELYGMPLWVFFLLCQIDYSVFKGGSAVPTLNRNHVESCQIVIPPIDVQNQYHELIAPLYWQRDSLIEQSETLATLRDTLLPKLMNRELCVEEKVYEK